MESNEIAINYLSFNQTKEYYSLNTICSHIAVGTSKGMSIFSVDPMVQRYNYGKLQFRG